METIRQQKIQELILREIGNFLRLKTFEWCPGFMLTVTKVNISKDFSVAKIYISMFGKANHDATLEIIRKHYKEIRYNLGNKINTQVRIIPELVFYEDDSLDYLDNINKLLKE